MCVPKGFVVDSDQQETDQENLAFAKRDCFLIIRDRKTHSLKLPLIISFKRFLVLFLRKVQDKMLKLNNTRIFMHVRQTERDTKTGDNVRKGATVRVNVDKKVLVG